MGFQVWFQTWSQGSRAEKSPGSLGQTWDKAKSLKFILIDSNFLLSPGLRPPVTLGVSHSLLEEFLRNVKNLFRLVLRESLDDTLRDLLPWDIALVIDDPVDEKEEEQEV
jgi:hypothetical protein